MRGEGGADRSGTEEAEKLGEGTIGCIWVKDLIFVGDMYMSSVDFADSGVRGAAEEGEL